MTSQYLTVLIFCSSYFSFVCKILTLTVYLDGLGGPAHFNRAHEIRMLFY